MTDLNSSNEFEMKIRRLQKSKKRNLIIKIVLCCIVFATILGYFILPVSRVSNTTVNGNINFTNEQIIQIAGLSSNDSLYLVSKDEIETNLKASPLIDDDSVEVKLSPLGLKINATKNANKMAAVIPTAVKSNIPIPIPMKPN